MICEYLNNDESDNGTCIVTKRLIHGFEKDNCKIKKILEACPDRHDGKKQGIKGVGEDDEKSSANK